MDTHVSVPPRALERRDAEATEARLNTLAFWYFVVTLALAFAVMAWELTTL